MQTKSFIALICQVRVRHRLKIAVISHARESLSLVPMPMRTGPVGTKSLARIITYSPTTTRTHKRTRIHRREAALTLISSPQTFTPRYIRTFSAREPFESYRVLRTVVSYYVLLCIRRYLFVYKTYRVKWKTKFTFVWKKSCENGCMINIW